MTLHGRNGRRHHLPVLQAIMALPGMKGTDAEIALAHEELGYEFGSTSANLRSRRKELCDLGMVRDSGERRPSGPSGRMSIVWEVTPATRNTKSQKRRIA